jgi:hypothetical protein
MMEFDARNIVLSKKEKQLIALEISLYSQDEYCIIFEQDKN